MRKDVDDLIQRLDERTIVVKTFYQPSFDVYPLQRAALRLRVSVADLVKAVLRGEIHPCRRNKAGHRLSYYVFNASEINKYKNNILLLGDNSYITVEDVSRDLGIKMSAVYFLIRKKLLRAEKIKCGTICSLRVAIEEFEPFKKAYVRASEVAGKLKTCSRHVIARLKKELSFPVSGSKIDGGPIYWLRRGDVARYLYVDQKQFKSAFKIALGSRKASMSKNTAVTSFHNARTIPTITVKSKTGIRRAL